jgi:hypothetical protein
MRHSKHFCILCEHVGHKEKDCRNYVGNTEGMQQMTKPETESESNSGQDQNFEGFGKSNQPTEQEMTLSVTEKLSFIAEAKEPCL